MTDDDQVRARLDEWLKILDTSSYYELLSILEVVDEAGIQSAFHRFSESFHPDNHRARSSDVREAATQIYRRGAEAYGVLRDPKLRAAYDLAMAQGALRMPPGTTGSSGTAPDLSLESACRSAAGRLHARQAERALSEGNIQAARALVQRALLAEGRNPDLSARFFSLLEIATGRPAP